MGKPGIDQEDVRIRKVLEEHWNLKSICDKCSSVLEKTELPIEGIEENTMMPFLHCPQCDEYFIEWGNNDED